MPDEADRLEPAETLTALLTSGRRHAFSTVSSCASGRHLRLCHVLQLVHILATCKYILQRPSGVRVVYILGHRDIVQLGETLHHLDLIFRIELIDLNRMAQLLRYLTQLCLYQL